MMLNYSFKVDYGTERKLFDYHTVTSEELIEIRNKFEIGIQVTCECEEKVPMKVGIKNDKPYLYNAKHYLIHTNCIRHSKSGSSIYERAWEFDVESKYYDVTLESPSINNCAENEVVIKEKNKIFVAYENRKSIVQYRAKMFGFLARLNLMVMESFVKGSKKNLPKNHQKFMQHMYGISNTIRLKPNKRTLNSQFLTDTNITKVEGNIRYFVYGEYLNKDKVKVQRDYDSGLSLIWITLGSGKQQRFYIDTEQLNNAIELQSHSEMFAIGGFVKKVNKRSFFSFDQFALLPITHFGLYVESKHELNVFNKFYKEEKLFYKPYLPIAYYNDYIPNYILIGKEKEIVGEIFEIRTEKHLKNKEEKIALSTQLEFKELYDFEYKEF